MKKPKAKAKTRRTTKRNTSYVNNNGKVLMAAMKTSQKLHFSFDDTTTTQLVFLPNQAFIARPYTVNSLFNMLSGVASATTNQAVAFRNWSRFYNRYLVEYVTIDVEFVNTSASPVYVGLAFKPINSEAWDSWVKYRNIESNTFPNKQELLTAAGGAKDRFVMKLKCKMGDLWGINTQQLGDTQFSALVTADPAIVQQAQIFALAPSQTAVTGAVVVKVKIDLVATLYQLKLQTGLAT